MNRDATFDDLCLVEGRAEIVNGRIVMLDAGGFAHSRAAMYIVGCFREGEEAHAEPALPGWRLSVDDVFDEAFPEYAQVHVDSDGVAKTAAC